MTHPLFLYLKMGMAYIPKDFEEWPDEWKKIEFKTYPRLKPTKLPSPDLGKADLANAILKRKSERDFSDLPLTLTELSTLLFYGAGVTRSGRENPDRSRRVYPSAGARYPLEVYVVAISVDELKPGLYHYNVPSHALEVLLENERAVFGEIFHDKDFAEFTKKASAIFIFSMVPGRQSLKYGNAAFKLAFIESGHLAQNMHLASAALCLKCCALAVFNDQAVHDALDIDGYTEIAFYALAIGK